MNSGGLTAILPSTSIVEDDSTVAPNGMTYTDERLSARWKERRARFLGCIENTKLIAERTKQRQESARIERLKKERAEMEKYRQRYLEAAAKQYMEQQAKPREASLPITQSHGHHYPQILSSSQSYPQCMQVLRGAPLTPSYPSISACKPNIRKRPFECNGGWTHYAHMAIVSGQSNASHGKEPEIFQNNPSPMQTTNSFKYPEMVSKQMPYCPTSNYKDSNKPIAEEMHQMGCIVLELEKAEQYDQARMGSSILPTTSRADEDTASTIPEEMSNLSTMPELAESQVKDLMDQIGPSNSLDDLGGNCLDGVLVNRCDEQPCSLDAETEKLKVQSISSSIVSPMSATCDTPNRVLSPAHLSASTRCSTNSFYDSHSTAVTPQQSVLTPLCDQSQLIPTASTLVVQAPSTVVAPDDLLLCTRNTGSSNSTSTAGSANAVSLTLVGNNNADSSSASNVNGTVYNSAAAIPATAAVPSQLHQSQQQYDQFSHFQQYHHSRHQQQQLLNLFNNGCHLSSNSAQHSHVDNGRIYSGIEYPTFCYCYNQYCNPNKSSIFPRIPSQTFREFSEPRQYEVHSIKYPNNGMPYYAPQPEMNVQQAYQFQVPLFQPANHHRHYHSDSLAVAAQNPVHSMNNF